VVEVVDNLVLLYLVVQEVLVEDQLEAFQVFLILLEEPQEQEQHVKVIMVELVVVQIMETLVVVELVEPDHLIQV
tara:strand:- start:240 stop:464 length:225 start_codon:yes stop_codon:yes gene_type:complete